MEVCYHLFFSSVSLSKSSRYRGTGECIWPLHVEQEQIRGDEEEETDLTLNPYESFCNLASLRFAKCV